MEKAKLLAVVVCLAMMLAVLAGCADNGGTQSGAPESSAPSDISSEPEHSEELHTHYFGEWEVIEKSTCTKAGYKQRKCVCGEIESSYLALSRHTEATDKRREATCTEDGLTRGKHCSVCQKVLVAQETIKARGHIESEWIIDKAATASEDGKCHTECKNCHAKIKEKTIAATGSPGLAYTVNSDEKSCTITGIGTCRESNIIIPSEIDGYIVTSIDTNAFVNCTLLTSVTIRKGVTSIGWSAFSGCTSLTSIIIPDSVTRIDPFAFIGCDALKNVYYQGDVENWCNIIIIGGHASNPCINGANLYFNGKLVTDLIIPDSVTRIGCGAFSDCTSLTSVTIPDSVTSIGNYTFSYCTSLTSVTIPNSVTSIDHYAFSGCTSLTSVTIPNSVTSIGQDAFRDCTSLSEINYTGTIEEWKKITIGNSAFYEVKATVVHCKDGDVSIAEYKQWW